MLGLNLSPYDLGIPRELPARERGFLRDKGAYSHREVAIRDENGLGVAFIEVCSDPGS